MDILKCPKMKNPGGFGQRKSELSLSYLEIYISFKNKHINKNIIILTNL